MWLLDTACAELHFFHSADSVPGGYAILSHTWSQDPARPEQTFQDLQAIIAQCRADGKNPRDIVCYKIRMCCETMERDGYAWVWIDTCCIDKTSSSELSEAINSMFTWYVLSEVCYAYLDDVGADDDLSAPNSDFRRARWHFRGWTLQELLAPAFVLFVSKDWKPMGTKHELADRLTAITGIPKRFLTRQTHLQAAPISEKMRWASRRMTTRVEDEAYCLLGIFDIKIPIIYGEGREAFYRLQVELSRRNSDATLYAWGGVHGEEDANRTPAALESMWDGFLVGSGIMPRFLFATSPSYFTLPSAYWTPQLSAEEALQPYLPCHRARGVWPFGSHEIPGFTLTGKGMECRAPLATVDGITVMVLFVETTEQHLGLILHPAERVEAKDPRHPLFYTSWTFETPTYWASRRLAELGSNIYKLKFRGKRIKPVWRDFYIQASQPPRYRMDLQHYILRLFSDLTPAPFRVPRWIVGAFASAGLSPDNGPARVTEGGPYQMVLRFVNTRLPEEITIHLGVCKHASTPARPVHWAWLVTLDRTTWGRPRLYRPHDCATDHVDDWDGPRAFGGERAQRTVWLSFGRCPTARRGRGSSTSRSAGRSTSACCAARTSVVVAGRTAAALCGLERAGDSACGVGRWRPA
ncbi:HET-domain-containing protein [Epithele typhae]|uniref:HET-domain-containing protein n=1 Tax=Epithele typhae TaxID=378194 RepID=UPI002007E341|nr:HET-domain-containing protein [Epithele typhae]KAH9935218.1 HET-domain-containing protein [Epithele typhae]